MSFLCYVKIFSQKKKKKSQKHTKNQTFKMKTKMIISRISSISASTNTEQDQKLHLHQVSAFINTNLLHWVQNYPQSLCPHPAKTTPAARQTAKSDQLSRPPPFCRWDVICGTSILPFWLGGAAEEMCCIMSEQEKSYWVQRESQSDFKPSSHRRERPLLTGVSVPMGQNQSLLVRKEPCEHQNCGGRP